MKKKSNSTSLKILSPAKLNLFLHILNKRSDGYHNLQTVFQFVELFDEITFTLRADNTTHLTSSIKAIENTDNLIFKAAQLLKQNTQTHAGVDIQLIKNIPMGAGLGGGSSDAASTLVALNYLWQSHLSLDQLANLGTQLGADVPVFVKGHCAWGEGIGNELTPITLPTSWYVILIPNCHIATAEIYASLELTQEKTPLKIGDYRPGMGENDFETVVCARYPRVAEAISWLQQFAPAHLTGTGCAVFAAFDSQLKAANVINKLPEQLTGLIAKGLSQSPTTQISTL